jgi:hypothetical protein
MRKLLICCALSMVGLFACVEGREAEPDPTSHGDELGGEVVEQSVAGGCCIDFTCPSPDFTTTGCKTGAGPRIREASDACNASCPTQCASSGLYCE